MDYIQIEALYLEGKTLRELEELTGIHNETIRRNLKNMGTPMRPRGQPFGKYLPSGGRQTDKSGYVLLSRPFHPNANDGGYVREHRLVMEAHLGRYLTKEEVVHHINGVKSDNRLENLQLYDKHSNHKSDELKGNRYSAKPHKPHNRSKRSPAEMLVAVRLLADSLDRPLMRVDFHPPNPSYKALNRHWEHWTKAVELAMSLPPEDSQSQPNREE